MIHLYDIRREALALPEAEEGTHFGLPSFKVRGKGFVDLQKDATRAIAHVAQAQAEALESDVPGTFESVWRSGSIHVGVRVDLAGVDPIRFSEVEGRAWRHRAPAALRKAHPGVGDGILSTIGRPALRELAAAGYTTLGQLTEAPNESCPGCTGSGRRRSDACDASCR